MDSVITDLDGRGVLVVESNLTGELWLSGNRITGFICVCSSFRDSFGPNFLQLSCSYSEQLGNSIFPVRGYICVYQSCDRCGFQFWTWIIQFPDIYSGWRYWFIRFDGGKKSIIRHFPSGNVLSLSDFLRYFEFPRVIYTRCFSGYGSHLRLG